MKVAGKTLKIIEVFRTDATKERYIREIARHANISSSTALRQLKNLSGEDILKERRRGKELLFRLNSENIITQKLCELNEASRTADFNRKNKRIKLVLDYLKKSFHEKLGNDLLSLIVFGSTARGTATGQSDVDLLVITAPVKEKYTLWKKQTDRILDGVRVQYGKDLAPVFISSAEFEEKLSKSDPLIKDVVSAYLILSGYEYFVDRLLKR